MKRPMMALVMTVALVKLVGGIGKQDYQDALISEQHTCAMVRDGIWPAEQAENYNCAEPVQVAGVE